MDTPSEPGTCRAGFLPLCVPEITGNAWEYVKQCLDDNWVSSAGPLVDQFDNKVADFAGGKFAVATVNGTAALHTALLVAGVQPDDEVIVSSLTFIASANAIRYAHAWPVFIDAEPDYWQMDPRKVADFLENECRWRNGGLYNKSTGRRVRAVMPVHILGHPVDMDAVLALARKHQLVVINDSTEALGTRYNEQKIAQLGDISCFSFNGNKLITTGGGGMLVTDNPTWAERARYLTTQAKDDPVEYIHNDLGYNYRLTNVQAALGCAQMEVVESYITKKRTIASVYSQAFNDVAGLQPMIEAPWAYSTFWMYTILVDEDQFGSGSRQLMQSLDKHRIQTRPLWQPLHQSPSFARLPKRPCPVAERLCRRSLSLPCSVGLRPEDQRRVIEIICNASDGRLKRSA